MRDGARVDRVRVPRRINELPSRRYYLYMMLPAIIVLACITHLSVLLAHLDEPARCRRRRGRRQVERLPQLGPGWSRDAKFINGWFLLLKYSAMCMVLEVGLGVLLAVILNRSRFEKTLVTIFLMPMMMAPVIAGLVWYYLYNSTFGWYHWLMQSVGLLGAKSILGDPDTAMLGIVIVDVWQWTPLIILITLAGLKRVPRDQLEANMVDGAGEVRNFFAITLPNLYPVPADRDPAALHGQFPLHRRHPGPDRRRAGGRDQDPADLSVRRLVPVLQARAAAPRSR